MGYIIFREIKDCKVLDRYRNIFYQIKEDWGIMQSV